jgi:secreted trypsin-like serine protease
MVNTFSGDSGGGMVSKIHRLSKLIGIVSAAVAKNVIIDNKIAKICDLDNYLIYTDVSKFNNWISKVIIETFTENHKVLQSSTIPPSSQTTPKTFVDKITSFFSFS